MCRRAAEQLTDEALINTGAVPPDHPAHTRVDQAVLVAATVDGVDVRHAEVKLNLCRHQEQQLSNIHLFCTI